MEIVLTQGNFEEEVEKSPLPVLVDFSAAWCGPCTMLAPIVAEVAQELEGRVKVGTVDVDAEPSLAARFGIMSIPALLVFREGKVSAQSTGLISKPELLKLLA